MVQVMVVAAFGDVCLRGIEVPNGSLCVVVSSLARASCLTLYVRSSGLGLIVPASFFKLLGDFVGGFNDHSNRVTGS